MAHMTFAEMAEPYLRRHWAVFPVSRDKRPLTPHGYKDASRDYDQARRWSEMFPGANIAIATGPMSGVLVLDIDGPDGEASFAELSRAVRWPEAPMVKSSRGRHLYFRCAGRVPSVAGRLGKGIDVKAAGGAITAPPSVHASGHVYHWTVPLGEQLPHFPLSLYARLFEPKVIVNRQPVAEVDLRDLADSVALTPVGGRNHALNVAAFKAGKLVRAGAVSYEAAQQALFEAARAAGLSPAEIRSTIRSGMNAGQRA